MIRSRRRYFDNTVKSSIEGGEVFFLDFKQQCGGLDASTLYARNLSCAPYKGANVTATSVDLDPAKNTALTTSGGEAAKPGWYSLVYTLTVRGIYDARLQSYGEDVAQSPFQITVAYAQVCPAECTAVGVGLSGSGVSETKTMRVTARRSPSLHSPPRPLSLPSKTSQFHSSSCSSLPGNYRAHISACGPRLPSNAGVDAALPGGTRSHSARALLPLPPRVGAGHVARLLR